MAGGESYGVGGIGRRKAVEADILAGMSVQNPLLVNGLKLNDFARQDLLLFGDGSVRPVDNEISNIAAEVQRLHPGGVNMILIGRSNQTGWKPMDIGAKGAYGILIGLLLPAVQKIREAASRATTVDLLRAT